MPLSETQNLSAPTPKQQKEKKVSEAKKVLKELQNAHKRAERERERLRREREREEMLRQKREEQLLRSRDRQLKKEQAEREKETRRLQREEARKQKEKEREDERQKKEEERLKREEEKRKKDAERHSKELERLKEEDEKRRKAEKQRAIMMGFLVRQDEKQDVGNGTSGSSPAKDGPFMQFQLKKDQRIAPLSRVSPRLLHDKRENVEQLLQSWLSAPASTDASRLGLHKFGQPNYIHELRTGQIRPLSSPSTWPVELPDVLFLGEGSNIPASVSLCRGHGNRGDGGTVWTKTKLFQFVENYRPAYYGTWRRRSLVITGRRPFSKDRLQLDYEVDSDDEWEEEEPGESITQSEDEEDEEVGDEDDDEDAKFLVPHGYLSDDEGIDADGGGEEVGSGTSEPLEMKKLRQRLSLAEYEMAHKRGLQRLRSLLLGPLWSRDPLDLAEPGDGVNVGELEDNKENLPLENGLAIAPGASPSTSGVSQQLMQSVLSAHRMYFWDDQIPVIPKMSAPPSASSSKVLGKMKKSFPDEAIPYLIQLIHKNTLSKAKLQFEFRVFWHRHTTGSAPSCVHYQEYKKRADTESQLTTMPDDVANQRTLRRASHLMSLESLALSKRIVLSKIGEIATFEEGRWMVRPEVLSKLGQELSATFYRQSVDEGIASVTSPDVSLPSWNYVSDVTSYGGGTKKSQKRTSQAEPPSTSGTPVAKVANVHSSPVASIVMPSKRTAKTDRTTRHPGQKRTKKGRNWRSREKSRGDNTNKEAKRATAPTYSTSSDANKKTCYPGDLFLNTLSKKEKGPWR
uniref:Chromatin assembly factor 1 subunit A n=1 Tax=Schistocephalus solidus TaxID=70667 RepID=A0A0X3PNJ8_SCHSO